MGSLRNAFDPIIVRVQRRNGQTGRSDIVYMSVHPFEGLTEDFTPLAGFLRNRRWVPKCFFLCLRGWARVFRRVDSMAVGTRASPRAVGRRGASIVIERASECIVSSAM